MSMQEATELSYADCRSLLAGGELGRVAVSTPQGPRIIPLNYTLADDSIVFRTTPYSLLGTYARNTTLAFEVDDVDPATHRGWSVVAVGRAKMVVDVDELSVIKAIWDPQPWVGGQRWMYFQLPWRELTGRRLRGSS
jgi:nitroimidazol reductase NimA-like FMN-containing flavoprotein (pyridoxamine 5'-phosphate oxidase superfamily)